MLRILLCTLAIVTFPVTSWALDIKTESMLTLQLQDMLRNFEQGAADHGWTVIPKGAVYFRSDKDITIPSILFRDAKNIETKIPDLHFTASKHDTHGWNLYSTSDVLIESHQPDGAKAYDFSMTGSPLTGTWDERLRHLSYTKAQGVDVTINDHLNALKFDIANIDLHASLTQTTPESWTGPMQGKAERITITSKHLPTPLVLPGATWSGLLSSRPSPVAVSPQNLFGTLETGTLTLKGLDTVLSTLQAGMITAPENLRDEYLKGILFVSALMGTGKQVADDKGSRSYDVTFKDDGSVLINGMDVTTLFTFGNKPS